MKPTSGDKLFFDTNILLYLTSRDEGKICIAQHLVESGGTISIQVLNEFVAVARRKFLLSWPAITAHLAPIRRACQIVLQHGQTFDRCIRVRNPFESKA